ncbi:MAG TPA: DUF2335 domain-containing protein [Hyphomicrobiaceae bacterium]|nr:DUF2335 domain-containing protein [Hyphomicrobiaceae bacterium]
MTDPRGEREVHVEMKALTWQAPIPPPEIIGGYNQVIQNGAERVFAQFEIEAKERRAFNRRGQTMQFVIQILARFVAPLVFALSALAVAAYAISKGYETAAAIIGGATIAMVVAAFTGVPSLLRQRPKQSPQDRR